MTSQEARPSSLCGSMITVSEIGVIDAANNAFSKPIARIWRGGLALFIAAIVMLTASATEASQKQKLEKSYKEWLDHDVTYIITKEERDAFLRLTSDTARDKFIEQFWEIRNPDPGSSDNTYKDEIYQRIAYANSHFGAGSGSEGWRTDRGRAYITLGPPQQTEVHRNAANLFPLEIWFYSFSHPALPPFFYLMFYQHEGIGDYRFYSPYIDGPDKLIPGTEAINDRQTALKMIQDSVGVEVARVSLSLLPDEPVDMTNATPSLQSDVLLMTVKGLANHPFTKQALDRRRGMLESVTARLVLLGKNLDVATLPVRDSHGLTRLDYVMRFRNPSDFTIVESSDGKYSYSMEARVRVFDSDNKLIFTQEKTVFNKLDKQQLNEIKDKRFGYEGSLPLPPGKYRLDFLLTDWQKKTGFQSEKEVTVPPIDENRLVVSGVLPFSAAEAVDPALADDTPFALAGIKFTPLGTSPLVLTPDQNLQIAYQIWTAPKDPHLYAGQKLDVEYALGRPAASGGATIIKDEASKEQFDPAGSLVNGKKLPLAGQPAGNYMLTVSVDQPGTPQQAFSTLNFSVVPNSPVVGVWDLSDPSARENADKGITDQERGLCYLAQGKKNEARAWFRRALDRDRTNEIARGRLVDAYYSQKDYAAIVSLYTDAGITEETDSETILRMAESLEKSGNTRKAISLLEEALSTRSNAGPLYLALASYYQETGNPQKAAELTRKGRSQLGQSSNPK